MKTCCKHCTRRHACISNKTGCNATCTLKLALLSWHQTQYAFRAVARQGSHCVKQDLQRLWAGLQLQASPQVKMHSQTRGKSHCHGPRVYTTWRPKVFRANYIICYASTAEYDTRPPRRSRNAFTIRPLMFHAPLQKWSAAIHMICTSISMTSAGQARERCAHQVAAQILKQGVQAKHTTFPKGRGSQMLFLDLPTSSWQSRSTRNTGQDAH